MTWLEPYDTFKKPTRMCVWCGRRHAGKKEECRECFSISLAKESDDPDLELVGGYWFNDRGVQRYRRTDAA